jgi:hypothetical protein
MAVAMLCNALAVPLFMLMLLISSTLRWAGLFSCGPAGVGSPASDSLSDSVREVPRKYETNRIVNQPFVSPA